MLMTTLDANLHALRTLLYGRISELLHFSITNVLPNVTIPTRKKKKTQFAFRLRLNQACFII